MTSHQLIRMVEAATVLDTNARYVLESLHKLSQIANEIDGLLSSIVLQPDGGPTVGMANHARERLKEIGGKARAFKQSQMFLGLKQLEQRILEFNAEFSKPDELLADDYTEHFRQLTASYEAFLETGGLNETINFIYLARQIEVVLGTWFDTVGTIRKSLSDNVEISTGLGEIELLLSAEGPYKDVVQRLESIQAIYTEVCELLNLSEREYPLRIVRLESGSVWLKLVGALQSINLVSWMIKGAIQFFHRNFTREGRIQALPKQSQALLSALGVMNQLKKAGLDTHEMAPKLEKAGALLARNLTVLLGDQPRVEVDGKIYALGGELEQKLIDEKRQHLLEHDEDHGNDKV